MNLACIQGRYLTHHIVKYLSCVVRKHFRTGTTWHISHKITDTNTSELSIFQTQLNFRPTTNLNDNRCGGGWQIKFCLNQILEIWICELLIVYLIVFICSCWLLRMIGNDKKMIYHNFCNVAIVTIYVDSVT